MNSETAGATDEYRAELARATVALRRAGCDIETFDDFIWGRKHYYELLPLLFELLEEATDPGVQAAIARSLQGHRLDKPARDRVIGLFDVVKPASEAQILLADLIYDNAARFRMDDLLRLAGRSKAGRGRGPVVWALGKQPRTPESVDLLRRLLSDPDSSVRGFAARALGRLRVVEARDEIERLVREEPRLASAVKEALSRIDAAPGYFNNQLKKSR